MSKTDHNTEYFCPGCGQTAWAKSDARLSCTPCKGTMHLTEKALRKEIAAATNRNTSKPRKAGVVKLDNFRASRKG